MPQADAETDPTEQDAFDAAFDAEAWEGDEPETADEPEATEADDEAGEPEAEPDAEPESEPVGEPEPEAESEPADEGAPAEETPAEAPEAEAETEPAEASGKTDLTTLLEGVKETNPELVNRVKSWEGRLSARDKEIQELKAENEKLRNTDNPADTPSGTGHNGGASEAGKADGPARDPETDKAMADFRAEWGDEIADFVEKRSTEIAANEVDSRVSEALDKRLTPVEQAQQEAREVHHQQTLDQQHPDWRDIAESDDLTLWMEEQPAYLKETYQRVVNEGGTDEVLDLLGRYKAARGMDKSSPGPEKKPSADKRKKAADAAPVRSGRTPPKNPGPPSDFESAFDYYASES